MTPREPDRYEEKADALFAEWARKGGMDRDDLAAALRREREEALEEAAQMCERVGGGSMDALGCTAKECARLIRRLATFPASPAAHGKEKG